MSNDTKAADAAISDARFCGKTIIVTGAGGNFGREGCLYFARRGANVAAMDNNENALNETLGEVVAAGCASKIRGYTCDVTDPELVEKTVESISIDFEGRIDMLWNNAGYQGQIKPTLEYDPADFARVMNINVTGMFIVLQSVARRMASQASAGRTDVSHPFSIVNTASVAALRGTPAMVAYASSKAAILAMTVSTAKVRKEQRSFAIRDSRFPALVYNIVKPLLCRV
jgi:NAD(P)-dependent dehydrogenase (short-subunit alcohol dehydrogenase family)